MILWQLLEQPLWGGGEASGSPELLLPTNGIFKLASTGSAATLNTNASATGTASGTVVLVYNSTSESIFRISTTAKLGSGSVLYFGCRPYLAVKKVKDDEAQYWTDGISEDSSTISGSYPLGNSDGVFCGDFSINRSAGRTVNGLNSRVAASGGSAIPVGTYYAYCKIGVAELYSS